MAAGMQRCFRGNRRRCWRGPALMSEVCRGSLLQLIGRLLATTACQLPENMDACVGLRGAPPLNMAAAQRYCRSCCPTTGWRGPRLASSNKTSGPRSSRHV